ncbi:hypothetical protein QBZ16_001444 [Prototheca wickerhamii]|uniref:Thioredoxin domain-containing protein n=1 Tax=Prototheca wickerhamii TaxID=3111 RepID=A0AAD9IEP5_PROWI|nr:hypothetical protein QBZ16_001444 [Prototheca wickerhamii]
MASFEGTGGLSRVQIEESRQVDRAIDGESGGMLVVVDVFAPWCRACRALYPKIVAMAEEQPDMIFLAVNYDANKLLAHELGVKVLPYFLLYRSSRGKIAGFSASLSKIQMLRDAIQHHTDPPCEIDHGERLGDAASIAQELGLHRCLLEQQA